MIKAFIEKNRSSLLLILVFIIAELIVNPIANIPLNDDWTYGRSVEQSLASGNIEISPIASASLFSHTLWGVMFVKIFGFSFTVLRFSTLISALISTLLLNKTIIKLTGNKLSGFICSLILLFNPIYFSLANTYMTDVNFITLIVVCIYFAVEFYETQKLIHFIMVFVFSVFAILLRQYGVIIPLCFAVSCLFLKNKRWLYTGLAIVFTGVALFIFKLYEDHLREVLPPNASYQFSGSKSLKDPVVIEKLLYNLQSRYKILLIHICVYGFPFFSIFLIGLFKTFKWYLTAAIVLLSLACTHLLFKDLGLPMGNVFGNKFVGAETFYQTFENGFHYELQHFSGNFENWITLAKYIFSTGTITCFILGTFRIIKQKGLFLPSSKFIFTLGMLVLYGFVVLFTEGFVDRYQLPLIAISLVLFAVIAGNCNVDYRLSLLPFILFFYISVLGTKDYLQLNRKRWEAVYFLKDRLGVDPSRINGGYEVSGWLGADPYGLSCMGIADHLYLIQYKNVEGYKMVREYEFQRYFPYKRDKIFIFMNLRKRK